MGWGRINHKNSHFSEEKLLSLVHNALDCWKQAESKAQSYKDNPVLYERYRLRSIGLRLIYMELLNEVRKRNVVMSREQLIKRILFPPL